MTFKEIRKILKTKKVGIAGVGGLGSNCAVALARIGIGKLIIVDFDKIMRDNLNRQYYFHEQIGQTKVFAIEDNILFINPTVKIEPHHLRLKPGNISSLFKKCDVIVEAFDLAETKQMFIETVQTELPHIPLVVGLGIAGWGDNNSLKTRQVGNLYICGDEKSEISDELPPLAPRVGIVAHMQANTVLEILINKHLEKHSSG